MPFTKKEYDEFVAHYPGMQKFADVLAHSQPMFQYPIDPEDVCNAAMEKAWIKQDQFQHGTNMKNWLATIVRTTYYDVYRAHKARGINSALPIVDESSAEDIIHRNSGIDIVMPPQEAYLELQNVRRLFNDLKKDQQDAIDAVVGGQEYQEFAAERGIPTNTAKTWVRRGRQRLSDGLNATIN